MKTRTSVFSRGDNRNGAALITVMGVVVLIAVVAASVVAMGRQQVFSSIRTRDYIKAQMNAESGVNDAYNVLKTNFMAGATSGSFPLVTFTNNGGTYDPDVTYPAGTSNLATITCVGTYGASKAVSKADVRNFPIPTTNAPPPLTNPYAFGVFCGGYMSYSGSSQFKGGAHINNYLYANGNANWGTPTNPIYLECAGPQGFSANNGTIYGTVKAPAISFGGTISDSVVASVPTIGLPSVDLTPYYNIAMANTQVVNGSVTVKKNEVWGNIPGGVVWINGNLTVNGGGSVTCTGCVIVTGSILINGTFNGVPVNSMPTLVSRDSTVEINGSHNIQGLVYSNGDMRFNGAGQIVGEIMAGGNLIFNGSSSVSVTYRYSEPGKSAYVSYLDYPIITAWQQ